MTVDQREYPRFDISEEPDNPSSTMRKALDALYRASVEVYRTSYRLVLLHAITRDKAFIQAVRGTEISHSLFTVRSGLAIASVLSLAGVFDRDGRTASLRLVLRHLTDSREKSTLVALHARAGSTVNVALQVDRLRRFQRRLKTGAASEHIEILKLLRDQHLAHFDLLPTLVQNAAEMGHLDSTLAIAANVVCTASRLATTRIIQTRDIFQDAKTQGQILTDAIKCGIEGAAPGRF